MELYERLKTCRNKAKMSQQDVADRMNIQRQTLSRWETGQGDPDWRSLVLLAEIYQVSLDELLKGENEKTAQTEIKRQHEIPEKKEKEKRLEWNNQILLFVLVVVSAMVPPLGILVPIVVLVKYGKKKQLEIIITILCILCILVSIYNVVIMLNGWLHLGVSYNVSVAD